MSLPISSIRSSRTKSAFNVMLARFQPQFRILPQIACVFAYSWGEVPMRLIRLWTAAVLFSGTQLWADVSFVTGFRIEPGPGMPPTAVGVMTQSMPAMPVIRTRIKGTRSTARAGELDIIMDGAKQEITLLDAASKTFAVGAMADYLSAVGKQMPKTPKMPTEVEQMMAGMQMASRKTDRTDVVEGIKVG